MSRRSVSLPPPARSFPRRDKSSLPPMPSMTVFDFGDALQAERDELALLSRSPPAHSNSRLSAFSSFGLKRNHLRHLVGMEKREKRGNKQKNRLLRTYENPSVALRLLDGFGLLSYAHVEDPAYANEITIETNHPYNAVSIEDLLFFENLVYLDAGENFLPLEPFGALPSLRELHLHCNNLRRFRIEEGSFRSLEILNLAYNQVDPRDILELSNIRYLRQLDLGCNGLRALPFEMDRFLSLERLSLEQNELAGDPVLLVLARIPKLIELNLDRNCFNRIPQNVKGFTTLEILSIASNELVFIEDIWALTRFSSLHSVRVMGNPIIQHSRDFLPFLEECKENSCSIYFSEEESKHLGESYAAIPLRHVKSDWHLLRKSYGVSNQNSRFRGSSNPLPNIQTRDIDDTSLVEAVLGANRKTESFHTHQDSHDNVLKDVTTLQDRRNVLEDVNVSSSFFVTQGEELLSKFQAVDNFFTEKGDSLPTYKDVPPSLQDPYVELRHILDSHVDFDPIHVDPPRFARNIKALENRHRSTSRSNTHVLTPLHRGDTHLQQSSVSNNQRDARLRQEILSSTR